MIGYCLMVAVAPHITLAQDLNEQYTLGYSIAYISLVFLFETRVRALVSILCKISFQLIVLPVDLVFLSI